MIPLTEWFLSSSVLILVVLLLRAVLGKNLSLRIRYALWAVVLIRLLIPFSPLTSAMSLSSFAQPLQVQAEEKMLYAIPTQTYENQYQYNTPHYSRTEHSQYINIGGTSYEFANYLSGGSVSHQGQRTDYFFLMPADELLTLIWKVGIFVCAIWMMHRNLQLSAAFKQRRTLYPVENCPVPVYLVEEGLPSPCLFGLFRPAIYLTKEAAADETALRHVLAHELTHYAHKDHIWSFLRCVCLALHWYNPLVWAAAILSRRDGELACDEGAVNRLGEEERLNYGRTLVGMVARRSQRPGDLLTCSTAMAEGKKPIQQRIQLLVKRPETKESALILATCAIALSLVLVFSSQSNPKYLEFTTYDQFLTQFDLSTHRWGVRSSSDIPDEIHPEVEYLLAQGVPVNSWVNRSEYEQAFDTVSISSFKYRPAELRLYEMENGCHLVERVHFEGDDLDSYIHYRQTKYQYYYLATLPSGTVQKLHDLVSAPTPVTLTQEELDFFNTGDFFDHGDRANGEGRMNIRNQFLSSFYKSPKDVDLFDLFYCGTGQNDRSIAETQQILSDIITSVPYYPDCGCTIVTTAEMDAVLTEHLGVSLEETNKVGLDEFDYIAAHDAYFYFHGDTNYGQMVHFTSGQRTGNTIELYYQDTFGLLGFVPCVLTLRQEGDRYYFYSNQPLYDNPAIAITVPSTDDANADANTFADALRTRYIFLNEHHPKAVNEVNVLSAEVFDRSESQLCVTVSLSLNPITPYSEHWMSGAGIDPINDGPYAGLWESRLDYLLELQPDGSWLCTKAVTGGLSAS